MHVAAGSSRARIVIKSRNRARSAWYRAFARFSSRPLIIQLPAEPSTRHSHPRPRFEIAISNIEQISLSQIRKVQTNLETSDTYVSFSAFHRSQSNKLAASPIPETIPPRTEHNQC